MKRDVLIKFRQSNSSVTVDIPSICPHCGESNSPILYQGWSDDSLSDYSQNQVFGLLARCTFGSCQKYYSLSYKFFEGEWKLVKYTYSPPIIVDLPDNIEKVSASFVEIYTQATTAESLKLDQIAGVGYRKSLEFLIKDYAIRYNPNEEDNIKKMLLYPCIKKYLSEFKRLQALATAATWIGNDETHYERRHTSHDIESMKRFIKSASQYIAAEYDADEAIEFVNPQEES